MDGNKALEGSEVASNEPLLSDLSASTTTVLHSCVDTLWNLLLFSTDEPSCHHRTSRPEIFTRQDLSP